MPPPTVAVIPQPESLTVGKGRFTISAATVIYADAATADIARRFAASLAPATGLSIPVRVGAPGATGIVLARNARLTRLGDEGYEVSATSRLLTVRARERAGVFYGLQTVRQLLPPEIFREARVDSVSWSFPAVKIVDRPRFAWRGAHLDVGRHFMPKEFVKKYIDLLALHKLNTFHWHLTDDQGWRLEIRKYPRLTSVGAWRGATVEGFGFVVPAMKMNTDTTKLKYDMTRHGGFYTQDDAREIVAYASARHITVVPEIEMPGHVRAAIAAYPALGVTGDTIPVQTHWGITPYILNADESTIRFMQDVLTEVMEIFPSRYIHVGGDEADKALWKTTPRIQARIKELGLKNESELQSWFIGRMDTFLARHGRRLVGWDEILDGGLAPGATVMSWRGVEGGVAAARTGHDVIMAPANRTYFDHVQSTDRSKEPLGIPLLLLLDSAYTFEPVPPALTPAESQHVLGAQAQLWTELIATPKHAEYMAFPRLAAFAEVVWTPSDRKNLASFHQRLARHLARLDALDVGYWRER